MRIGVVRAALVLVLVLGVAACAPNGKFKRYDGPEVTRIVVMKSARKMYLLHDRQRC